MKLGLDIGLYQFGLQVLLKIISIDRISWRKCFVTQEDRHFGTPEEKAILKVTPMVL